MKADISSSGDLVITCGSETDNHALRAWVERFNKERSSLKFKTRPVVETIEVKPHQNRA